MQILIPRKIRVILVVRGGLVLMLIAGTPVTRSGSQVTVGDAKWSSNFRPVD